MLETLFFTIVGHPSILQFQKPLKIITQLYALPCVRGIVSLSVLEWQGYRLVVTDVTHVKLNWSLFLTKQCAVKAVAD